MSRVLVIGLDGFSFDLVEEWLDELTNLRKLMESGIYGPLQSIVQPVTPAAWTAMITGRDPGHFGFTDFACRTENSYTDFKLVHSRMIKVPTLFSILSGMGRRVWMVGVPISYPPIPLPDGGCVSCFMAPSLSSGITQPSGLQEEILSITTSPYLFDVSVTDSTEEVDRDDLLRRILELDRQRFDTVRYLMQSKPWDMIFMTCMGTDRIGHYFMRFQDPLHGRYDPDPRYRDAILNHYRYCDERIGELISVAGSETVVLVVSDHGMQRMDGKVNLNDWLASQGYLCLTESVDRPVPINKAPIDWKRTRAWARGYGGQIYLNVLGRESEGCVEPAQVDPLLNEIVQRLGELTDPQGKPLRVQAFRGKELYSGPYANRCPDLCIQFEECRYLTSDKIGHKKIVSQINELGLDDAAHAPNGVFAMAGPGVPNLGRFVALHLYDVAPTVLDLMGAAIPSDLEGQVIHKIDEVYSEEDEDELLNRLRALYLE